jgi:radical SAM protein with 4Fe4S-binding SPASM domain
MISLDGIESTHNNQRISLDGNNNPYTTTLNNIKRLVQYGLRDKLKVQASLPLSIISDDGIMARQFYKDMLMAGVKLENIHFGFTSPTRKNPKVSHNFRERMSKVEFHRPCCKYRLDTHYIIDDGGLVYADYFEDVSETYLGTLNDEISTIETNHVNLIKRTIPVLNDDKCIKCPVVGMCWGWCAASHNHFVKPSEYCSQELLHESIKASAEAGTLSKRLFGDKGPFTPGQTPTAF